MSPPSRAPLVVAASILVLGVGGAVWIVGRSGRGEAPPQSPTPMETPTVSETPTASETPTPSPHEPSPQASASPSADPVDVDPAPADEGDLFAGLDWDYEADAEKQLELPPKREPRPVELRTSEAREARLQAEAKTAAERTSALREQLATLGDATPPSQPAESPAALFEAARDALGSGRVEEALAGFERAREAGAPWVPELDPIRQAGALFHGQTEGTPPSSLTWTFAPGADLDDFQTWGPSTAEVATDELQLASPTWFRFGLVSLRGRWSHAKVGLVLGGSEPSSAVGFAHEQASYAIRFGTRELALVDLAAKHDEPPIATADQASGSGTEASVTLEPGPGSLTLVVVVDGDEALRRELPWSGPIRLSLGTVKPGTARFVEARIAGELDPVWLASRRAEASEDAWDALREQELARRDEGELPLVYATTSAEDEVGLAGVPQRAQERLDEARALLRDGDDDLVAQFLQQASSRSDDYGAAHVLHARALLSGDPLGSLRACGKALKAVAGFYEAHACRAEALRRLGRRDEARAAVEEALALRADYAPAWVTRAWLDLGQGQIESAREAVLLASALAPDDPGVAANARAIRAWLEGPPGLQPHDHGERLRVWARSADDAQRAARQVTAIRKRCQGLLGRLFPAPPDAPQSPSRVLVFSDPAAYTRYLRLTQQRRAGAPWGSYQRATGELVLLRAESHEAAAEHRLRHEAVHQWLHERGAVLPGSWAVEGLADVLAGVSLDDDGQVTRWGVLDAPLREQLRLFSAHRQRRLELFDIVNETGGWRQAVGSLRYVQAGLFVRWLLAHPELNTTWRDYLSLLAEGGRDPEREQAELLEQAFMATFYEADLVGAEPEFVAWLEQQFVAIGD